MKEIKCETCKYWQDYKDRVMACVLGKESNHFRNQLELRACKFIPHPSASASKIYTDKDYFCSEHVEINLEE